MQKAKALAGTEGTELERLGRVAKFVRGINHIAIQISVGRGGGYRPHAAADVFTKAYGDCKDKGEPDAHSARGRGHGSLPGSGVFERPFACPRAVALALAVQPLIVAIRVAADTRASALRSSFAAGLPEERGTDGVANRHRCASPVMLDAGAFRETVRATLSREFEIDEMPDAVNLSTPFGSYRSSYAVKDRVLTFTRELEVKAATIPASGFSDVRKFFATVYGSGQAPAALVKK